MDDLISRQAAIDVIGKKSDEIYKTKQKGATYPHDDFFQGMAYAESVVKQLPSAQPQQTGQWINHAEDGYVECPFCHSATNCDDNISDLHFCFSCGARMDEE